jgi:hypothetical protein
MRKLVAIVMVTCFLLIPALALADRLVEPFEKAREYALKGTITERGYYMVEYVANEDGKEIMFMMAAYPVKSDTKWAGSVAIAGVDANGKFHFLAWDAEDGYYEYHGFALEPLTPEQASERAFKIFREMVKRGLI